MKPHPIVSRNEWLAARRIEKEYLFDTEEGRMSLAGLFGRNSQLIVHHFMCAPDWDAGCPSCSLEADHAEGSPAKGRNETRIMDGVRRHDEYDSEEPKGAARRA